MSHYTPFPRLNQFPAHLSITLSLADSTDDLLVRHVRLLRDCVALAQSRWAFEIDAAVVLPNQLHMLCAFPDAEFGVNSAIRLITSAFARHAPTRDANGRVWDNTGDVQPVAASAVVSRRAFIEAAPVRAGLVKAPEDWPFSSAHVGVAQGTELGVALA